MKSLANVTSFVSFALLASLAVVACQEESSSTPNGGGPGAGGSSAGGSSQQGGAGGSNNQGGSNPTGGTAGSSAGTGGTSGDPCGGEEKTIQDLNKVKAPLPENRLRLKGVVATSRKFLVSPSASGCLWGVFVTAPGASVVEYGSIQLVSKGSPPETTADGKTVCKTNQEDSGVIPNEIQPGDALDVSGFLDEFLLSQCGKPSTQDPNVNNPRPDAGQRQIKDISCLTKVGSGAVPAPAPISDAATLTAIAQGKNTDDLLYKWSGALVQITAPLTSKQVPETGAKYFNCSAVSGFGDINFEETELTVGNGVYYNDLSCAGPRDNNKRYDFQQPTTFASITGIVALDFCTWQVSTRSRCDDILPKSPTCDLATDACAKVEGATKCTGTENTVEACTDNKDNDGNSFIDCNDFGCCKVVDCKTLAPNSTCAKQGSGGSGGGSPENTVEACTDKVDNDNDKFTDCDDFDCCALVDCKTTAPDSACAKKGSGGSGGSGGGSPENTVEACTDKVDNDNDKFIDCNDFDCCKVVDCKTLAPDSSCAKQGTTTPENTVELCSDGKDNDGDKFIDCDDFDCCALIDCKTTAPSSACGKKLTPLVAALLTLDLGELPDEPEALYALAQIAAVACGGHAGDEASMERAVALASRHGVTLAAHPSYPDREHFGRRSLTMSPEDLRRSVAEQCAALRRASPAPVRHAKAHGALYHDLARDPGLAAAFLAGVSEGLAVPPAALVILGPPGLPVGEAALLREGFADRGYDADGRLLPRGATGALLLDPAEAAAQARRLAASGRFDVLCVHGDTPGAVAVARAVRLALGSP
jgi:UPF0271 protein